MWRRIIYQPGIALSITLGVFFWSSSFFLLGKERKDVTNLCYFSKENFSQPFWNIFSNFKFRPLMGIVCNKSLLTLILNIKIQHTFKMLEKSISVALRCFLVMSRMIPAATACSMSISLHGVVCSSSVFGLVHVGCLQTSSFQLSDMHFHFTGVFGSLPAQILCFFWLPFEHILTQHFLKKVRKGVSLPDSV